MLVNIQKKLLKLFVVLVVVNAQKLLSKIQNDAIMLGDLWRLIVHGT